MKHAILLLDLITNAHYNGSIHYTLDQALYKYRPEYHKIGFIGQLGVGLPSLSVKCNKQ